MTTRGRQLAAAGLPILLATAITACGGNAGVPSADPEVPTSTPAPTVRHAAAMPTAAPERARTARSGSPSTPVGTPAAKRTPAHANTPSRTTAPATPACTTSALSASQGHTGTGRYGWFATPVLLRNRSASTCHLRGWPGLKFFGDGALRACAKGDISPACGKPVSTSGPRSFSVTRTSEHDLPDVYLAPGHTTSFTIVWEGSYASTCYDLSEDPAYGVDIRVPGDSRALTLADVGEISPCGGRTQVTPFGVTG
ncbi:DUF4232 domain-containing protein [Streptomyces sp. NPDC002671]